MKTIASLLLVALLVVSNGCGKLEKNSDLDASAITAEDRKMVEQKTGVSIPIGSHGLNMYIAGAEIDPAFMAKIEIPKAESEDFVKKLEQMPSESVSVTNYLIGRVSWWRPSEASTQVERRFFKKSSGDFVDLLLCDENGNKILYVDWASR